jgi:hypothetical protein
MKIIEFIAQNIYSITFVITIFAGLFAFAKWIDSRNREIKKEELKEYMRLISVISGGGKITEQVASVYMLLEYKKYYKTTLKVLDNGLWNEENDTQWQKYILPAIRNCIKEINSSD